MTTVAPSAAWVSAIDAFLADQLYNDVAGSTVELRRVQLRAVARRLDVENPYAVTRADLRAWQRDRAVAWKRDTRRSYRTTLRGFYGWALENRLVEDSPALGLKRVRPAPANPQAAPDRVYLPALMVAGPRERLMMRLAAVQALRCCEVAVLHTSDVVEDDDDGWSLLVHGKGAKERLIGLDDDVARDLRLLPPGYAFPSQRTPHLTANTVGRLCNPLLEGRWTMHKLRHRAATRFYRACGKDINETAAFLGHSDPAVTLRYVEPSRGRQRAALRELAAA